MHVFQGLCPDVKGARESFWGGVQRSPVSFVVMVKQLLTSCETPLPAHLQRGQRIVCKYRYLCASALEISHAFSVELHLLFMDQDRVQIV